MHQKQSQGVQNAKLSRGACPQTPLEIVCTDNSLAPPPISYSLGKFLNEGLGLAYFFYVPIRAAFIISFGGGGGGEQQMTFRHTVGGGGGGEANSCQSHMMNFKGGKHHPTPPPPPTPTPPSQMQPYQIQNQPARANLIQ